MCTRIAITFRNWSVIPQSKSGRMTFLAILVCGTLVHSHWRAALVSTLTVSWFKVKLQLRHGFSFLQDASHKSLQYPFETLQGLSESDYELRYLKGGAVASILSQSHKDTIFGKLWKNVRNFFSQLMGNVK